MANIYTTQPISQLTPLTNVSGGVILPVVDPANTTQAPTGTTSQMTVNQLQTYLGVAATGSNKQSCQVVSVVNLSAVYNNGEAGVGATLTNNSTQATFEVDGVVVPVNGRVLIAGQTSTFQNGIYVVTNAGSVSTNWVLTRSADYNGSAMGTIAQGDLIAITLGDVYAESLWLQNQAGPFVMGTTSIVFVTKRNFQFNDKRVTGDYSASYADYFISVDTTAVSATITLPPLLNNPGQGFVVKDVGANAAVNNITINVAGGVHIDEATTAVISNNNGALQFYISGSQYYIW